MAGAKNLENRSAALRNAEDHQRNADGGSEQNAQGTRSNGQGTTLHGPNSISDWPHGERIERVSPPVYERAGSPSRGYIIVTTDKGLCGGLNVNLLKAVVADMKKWVEQDVETDLC